MAKVNLGFTLNKERGVESVNSISISGMLTPSHSLGQNGEAKMAAHVEKL